MEEKQMNGLNLENILSKVPSEEIRNEVLVDAVERGLTNNPEYFDRAVQILEQEKKYAALASLYSNKERTSYDADKALLYYKKAIASYGFKKDAKKRIGAAAVLGEMGRKIARGLINFASFFYAVPTFLRKYKDFDEIVIMPNFILLVAEIAIGAGVDAKEEVNMQYALIPLAIHASTNLASGLYEWYHYEKNKLREKTDKSELEEKVEESHEKVSQDSAPALTIEEAIYNPVPTADRQKLAE